MTTGLLKLDLGCGQRPADGFQGVDIAAIDGVSQFDLTQTPWPWPDESVGEVVSNHFLEHLTGPQRIAFMDELWRVLVLGGKATIVVPYWSSVRAVQDPTHAWPPLSESSFLYFNRGWREANGLDHYPVRCNYDFVYGYDLAPEWQVRAEEAKGFAVKHYNNVVMNLQVVLTKAN